MAASIRVSAILERDGEFLVYPSRRKEPKLFGGRVKRGESLQYALRREIFEEIGITGTVSDIVAIEITTKGIGIIFRFIVRWPDATIKSKPKFKPAWVSGVALQSMCKQLIYSNSSVWPAPTAP